MYIIILKEGNETDLRAVYISRASPTHKNNRLNKNLLSRQLLSERVATIDAKTIPSYVQCPIN